MNTPRMICCENDQGDTLDTTLHLAPDANGKGELQALCGEAVESRLPHIKQPAWFLPDRRWCRTCKSRYKQGKDPLGRRRRHKGHGRHNGVTQAVEDALKRQPDGLSKSQLVKLVGYSQTTVGATLCRSPRFTKTRREGQRGEWVWVLAESKQACE